jgi:hypothetical protein
MTEFRISDKKMLGSLKTVSGIRSGVEIPILSLICHEQPVNLDHLTQNVVAVLNGAAPPLSLTFQGERTGWLRQVNGVEIKNGLELYVQRGHAHQSKSRIVLRVNHEADETMAKEVMARLCDYGTIKGLMDSFDKTEPTPAPPLIRRNPK